MTIQNCGVTDNMRNDKLNPITASIKYLVECGYTKEEAKNLMQAVQDESPERLLEIAPKWIEHVGEHKRYQEGLLGLIAKGCMTVTMGSDGEWMFRLNDAGIEAGKAMGLK